MQILSIPENILLFIAGFGIVQGFLLSALLYFHPRSNKSVNIFLALYIAIISVVMTGPFILNSFSWRSSLILQPLPLLIGPLLYIYVKSHKQKISFHKAIPHFILLPVYFAASYAWYTYLGTKYEASTVIPIDLFLKPQAIVLSATPYLHLLFYYFKARHELATYQFSIKHLLSETSRVNLGWVKWLINGFLFVIVSATIIYMLIIRFPQHFTIFYLITMAIATPYIYIITYKGITQSSLWMEESAIVKKNIQERSPEIYKPEKDNSARAKVQKQDDNKKMQEIVAKIITVMEEEKLYQEPELTLQNIADKLQFPTYQVSQAINDGMNKSFYELINGYRVDEAKLLLLNPKNRNFTILSVGFEAGFNSKTTFNTVFKKFTGMTPTEFREHQKEEAIRA